MTTLEAYEHAHRQLGDIDEARAKARLLVDVAAGVRYAHLVRPHTELDAPAGSWLFAMVERVARGYPLAYALGHCEFHGHEFHCDERALIPRPETETLVETALQHLNEQAHPLIADLGTGTGCIAVSIALAIPGATLDATDVSQGALGLAAENAQELGAAEQIHFTLSHSGIWKPPGASYEAILSNPPYIAVEEIANLQREIRDWEPHSALDGGADGLDCYRQIAAQCAESLNPGGFLLAELGIGQFEDVAAIFELSGWRVAPPIYDLAGIARVIEARR